MLLRVEVFTRGSFYVGSFYARDVLPGMCVLQQGLKLSEGCSPTEVPARGIFYARELLRAEVFTSEVVRRWVIPSKDYTLRVRMGPDD